MLTSHSWNHLGAWVVMLLVSVASGGVRDLTSGMQMTERAAHQLSTMASGVLLGSVTWFCIQL